ncbi:MAG: tetratricopeptide repeat protein [Desulfobacterales bacterium]|jgi:tetratricopeptide (TPR) repeat protein|nr:tetratricopeptide repeat protein [Desulfobacterales bacterium]
MKPMTIRFQIALITTMLVMAGNGFYLRRAAAATDPNAIPTRARAALSAAIAQMNEKAYDRAIDILKAFQAKAESSDGTGADPNGRHHPEVYFTLGTCYLFKGNYQQAVRNFEETLKKDSGHLSAWLNLAKASYDLGDFSRAAQSYTKAYDAAVNKKPEYLYYSAAAFLMAQQHDRSIEAFQRLFSEHADKIQAEWRENFIHALLTANRPKEALPLIRRMAEQCTDEKKIQWQEILLKQYMQLDMRSEARSYARLLTQEAPTRAKWWKALAHVELQDGKHEPALVALMIYSYLTPLTDQETKLLADLSLQLGIPVKAAPLYEASLRNHYSDRLLQNLMVALQQMGQFEAALNALQQFAPQTEEPNLLMLKADFLYSLSDFKAAAQAYRQVAGMESKQKGRAWLMTGYAALQDGDVPTCRLAFEKAAAFDQHRTAARLAMQRLPKMASEKENTNL